MNNLENPFCSALGLVESARSESFCRLEAPGAGHGGLPATLAVVGAERVASGKQVGPLTVVSMHAVRLQVEHRWVGRLAVESRLLAVEHELAHCESKVLDEAGCTVLHAGVVLSAARGGVAISRPPARNAAPNSTEFMFRVPGLERRGIAAAAVGTGIVQLALPARPPDLDEGGRVHHGALVGLIDAAGASAPWTLVDPAWTSDGTAVALHVRAWGPLPGDGLIAQAAVRARDAAMFWTDVVVHDLSGTTMVATGSAAYRFG